jgi:hypothetical protein
MFGDNCLTLSGQGIDWPGFDVNWNMISSLEWRRRGNQNPPAELGGGLGKLSV